MRDLAGHGAARWGKEGNARRGEALQSLVSFG